MKKSILKNFAKVITKIGVNLQKGQDALVYVSTQQREFAAILTETLYKAGARRVFINWVDEGVLYQKYKYESYEDLAAVLDFEELKAKHMSDIIPVRIFIEDDDPEAFNGLDTNKIISASQARRKILKKYRDITDGKEQWCIAALPSYAWAKMLFPNDTKKVAFNKLWDLIVKTTRLEGNAVDNWNKHVAYLQEKADKIQSLKLKYLQYNSSNGTNLKIKLHDMHLWESAGERSQQGIFYVANMPTEEVFTMPDRFGVDGVVHSSKPLSYNGSIIDDFTIWFEKGKAVKYEAKVGYDVLKSIIEADENSCRLGEVALVPFNSPINETGVLFYNTLFDENACCHLAFGQAFKDNLVGYETMSEEEFKKIDFNDSIVHVDFMIGTPDLMIKGYDENNNEYIIFKDGIWNI